MVLRQALLAVAVGFASVVTISAPADAGSRQYRSGPQVKGYVARRGGYSYKQEDTINTYGDARSKYGGATSLRDPMLDRQTIAGPFDHGFFFDSPIAPHGGESPYMQ